MPYNVKWICKQPLCDLETLSLSRVKIIVTYKQDAISSCRLVSDKAFVTWATCQFKTMITSDSGMTFEIIIRLLALRREPLQGPGIVIALCACNLFGPRKEAYLDTHYAKFRLQSPPTPFQLFHNSWDRVGGDLLPFFWKSTSWFAHDQNSIILLISDH